MSFSYIQAPVDVFYNSIVKYFAYWQLLILFGNVATDNRVRK
jgi:hypothetical protein